MSTLTVVMNVRIMETLANRERSKRILDGELIRTRALNKKLQVFVQKKLASLQRRGIPIKVAPDVKLIAISDSQSFSRFDINTLYIIPDELVKKINFQTNLTQQNSVVVGLDFNQVSQDCLEMKFYEYSQAVGNLDVANDGLPVHQLIKNLDSLFSYFYHLMLITNFCELYVKKKSLDGFSKALEDPSFTKEGSDDSKIFTVFLNALKKCHALGFSYHLALLGKASEKFNTCSSGELFNKTDKEKKEDSLLDAAKYYVASVRHGNRLGIEYLKEFKLFYSPDKRHALEILVERVERLFIGPVEKDKEILKSNLITLLALPQNIPATFMVLQDDVNRHINFARHLIGQQEFFSIAKWMGYLSQDHNLIRRFCSEGTFKDQLLLHEVFLFIAKNLDEPAAEDMLWDLLSLFSENEQVKILHNWVSRTRQYYDGVGIDYDCLLGAIFTSKKEQELGKILRNNGESSILLETLAIKMKSRINEQFNFSEPLISNEEAAKCESRADEPPMAVADGVNSLEEAGRSGQKESSSAAGGAKGRLEVPFALLEASTPEQRLVDFCSAFYKQPIEGDGNCLFSAVSQQLKRLNPNSPATHQHLRQQVVAHIRSNMPRYIGHIGGDIVHYLTEMEKDGAWGGELEIIGLCAVLGVSIQVIQPGDFQPNTYGDEPERPLFYLAYNGDNHYDSLIPRQEWEQQRNLRLGNSQKNEGVPGQFDHKLEKTLTKHFRFFADNKPRLYPIVQNEQTMMSQLEQARRNDEVVKVFNQDYEKDQLESISSGSSAIVFGITLREHREKYAIKIINSSFLSYESEELYFREFSKKPHLNLLATLGHVSPGKLGDESMSMFAGFIMERADKNLSDWLAAYEYKDESQNKIMRCSVFYDFAENIASGLEHLHTVLKLVHYDLKPANIMVFPLAEGKFLFKIGDFGSSQEYSANKNSTHDQQISVPYAAQELISLFSNRQLLNIMPCGDCFSLALIFLEFISLRAPYSDPEIVAQREGFEGDSPRDRLVNFRQEVDKLKSADDKNEKILRQIGSPVSFMSNEFAEDGKLTALIKGALEVNLDRRLTAKNILEGVQEIKQLREDAPRPRGFFAPGAH